MEASNSSESPGIFQPIREGVMSRKKTIVVSGPTKEDVEKIVDEVWHEKTVKPRLQDLAQKRKLLNARDPVENIKLWMKKTDAEVSDDQFFECIKANPILLASYFAYEKITRWQKEMNSETGNKVAQKKLKKIGTVLALKNKREGISLPMVMAKRTEIYQKVKEMRILALRSIANRKITLKEAFGETIIDSADIDTCMNDSELANEITAKIFGLTRDTVEKYCKSCKKEERGPCYVFSDK